MKMEVAKALEELTEGLPNAVRSKEDDDGGAYVLIEEADIGQSFAPASSWVAFHITFSYPDADVYPHFIDAQVRYTGYNQAPSQHPDGNLPAAMSRGAMAPGFELPAIQISRKSNRRNSETDSALTKLLRVIDFLRTR